MLPHQCPVNFGKHQPSFLLSFPSVVTGFGLFGGRDVGSGSSVFPEGGGSCSSFLEFPGGSSRAELSSPSLPRFQPGLSFREMSPLRGFLGVRGGVTARGDGGDSLGWDKGMVFS